LHCSFTGNGIDGTDKVAAAGIYGDLLKELGLLSVGGMVHVTEAEVAVSCVGQANALVKAYAEARGRVLLVEVAHGTRCEALVPLLRADKSDNDDMCIILAGQQADLAALTDDDPGFQRRFGRSVHFEGPGTHEPAKAPASSCSAGGTTEDSGKP
jgi:hypothetical protein